jgi:hypothetical protein
LLPALPQETASEQQVAGIAPEWDIRKNMQAFVAHVRRLEPLVGKIKPADWQGAPATYGQQWRSAQSSVYFLITAAENLAKQPERVTAVLQPLFQMDKMELLLGSLSQGVRKYQSPELADQVTRVLAENANFRDSLERHALELAQMREQEFQVVDQEAQRCRGTLSRQTGPESRQPRREARQTVPEARQKGPDSRPTVPVAPQETGGRQKIRIQ